jgi:plastocyanin
MRRLAPALAALVATIAVAAPASAAPRALLLTGTVGPNFTIKMSAKSVKAGTYVITIKDLSSFHNFHLTGPGVDKWTSVQKVVTSKWNVKLRKGTYRFVCDPHSTTMKGTLKVS